MSDDKNQTDPVLLQMVGTLAELKQGQQQQSQQLSEILADIRKFDVALAELQKDVTQAQTDIGSRTHREETLRLIARVDEVERDVRTRAGTRLVYWILGMLGTMMIALLVAVADIVLKKP